MPIWVYTFFALALISCGYHSVNQPAPRSCVQINDLQLTNHLVAPNADLIVEGLLQRYFPVTERVTGGLDMRLLISPGREYLTGYTADGNLAAKTIEIELQLDLLQGKKLIWSATQRAHSRDMLIRVNPRWSSSVEDQGLRQTLERGIADLRIRLEDQCARIQANETKP
ncbi:MAG: hypothetical protein ACPGQS_02270 [Bradymonadia bacterium]